jgi:hypothetical protein
LGLRDVCGMATPLPATPPFGGRKVAVASGHSYLWMTTFLRA